MVKHGKILPAKDSPSVRIRFNCIIEKTVTQARQFLSPVLSETQAPPHQLSAVLGLWPTDRKVAAGASALRR